MGEESTESRVQRFDTSAVKASRAGPSGGLIVSGNLRRVGVLDYRMADGSTRRELCHPDEVFHADACDSFRGAPITVDHPGLVTPENWAKHAVGHVGDAPVKNGRFLSSNEMHVQDASAIHGLKSGKLQEVSCGYSCTLDATPGVYMGERYDAIQRNIRVNHVALGPKGWGRAGPDVRVHMDGGVSHSETGESDETVTRIDAPSFPGMTPEEKAAFEKAQADLKAKDVELEKLRADAKNATTAAEKAAADAKELEVLRAKTALLESQAARQDTVKSEQEGRARQDAKVNELVGLRETARRVFATAKDPSGSKWKADGKSPDEIRREVLGVVEPDFSVKKLDGTLYEGEALNAVYTMAIAKAERVDAARGALMEVAAGARTETGRRDGDGDDDDEPVADAGKARRDMIKRQNSRFVPATKRDRMARDGKGAR